MFNSLKHRIKEKVLQSYARDHNMQSVSATEKGDLFITAYPKSGNTWMQYLMTGILYQIDMKKISQPLVMDLVPDVHFYPHYRRYLKNMCFKSHFLPQPQYRKVIHLVRDPRDVMASFYAYLNSLGLSLSQEEVIKEGKHIFLTKWFEHSKGWIENPYDSHKIVIKYEDLLKDAKNELQKVINEFELECSEYLLTEIVHNCSFAKMKQDEQDGLWVYQKGWVKGNKFIRKGKTGNFKQELKPEMIEWIINEAGEEMKILGYNS